MTPRKIRPVSVPVGEDHAAVLVDITNMLDPSQSVTVLIECSLDGGDTWKPPVEFTFCGGPLKPRAAPPPYWSKVGFEVPEPANPSRLIRGEVTFAGRPFVSNVRVETKRR